MHHSHYQPTRSQHLMLVQLYRDKYGVRPDQQIVVHHVLKDTPTELYVQIEQRCPVDGITFARVWI